MNKSILFLAFLAPTGDAWAGQEDASGTLMSLVETYRILYGAVQQAESSIRIAEALPTSDRKDGLEEAYTTYEQTSKKLETLLIDHPDLRTYIANENSQETIVKRPCTPDGITFSSFPYCRASSPDVPRK